MRKLSSDLTWFYKRGMPIFSAMLLLGGAVMFLIFLLQPPPNTTILELLGFWFVWFLGLGGLSALFISYGRSLKKVSLQGETLIVTDYRRQVKVSIREVHKVTGSRLLRPDRITLYFRHPTEFGSKITFLTRYRWSLARLQHPLVWELQEMAERGSVEKR